MLSVHSMVAYICCLESICRELKGSVRELLSRSKMSYHNYVLLQTSKHIHIPMIKG